MEDCEALREGRFKPGNKLGDVDPADPKDPKAVAKRVHEALKPEALRKKGRFTQDEVTVDIFLGADESYSVINIGETDSHHSNTSTLISIDANHDGKLDEEEGWFANLPVRIGDQMWEVITIAPDGSQIVIEQSDASLQGIVQGAKCPFFAYKTDFNQQISLETFEDKALLIDIWSLT